MHAIPPSSSPEPSQSSDVNWFKRSFKIIQQTPWLRRSLFAIGIGAALLVPALAGVYAVNNLLTVAESPNCQAGKQPDNLAARISCADEMASKRTVGDLRDAIKLISTVPQGSPLRATVDRRLDRWSLDLMELAEEAYQNGDLDAAVSAAQAVSVSTSSFTLAGDRIHQWKDVWEKGEDICKRAKEAIEQQEWTNTLSTARELLKLGNRYWSTTRYQDLMNDLQVAKDAEKAQKKAAKRAQSALTMGLEGDATAHLRKAKKLVRQGDAQSLRDAIAEAQQVFYGTAAYEEAQKLIDQWEKQAGLIEDRQHLDRAIQLAKKGTEAGLQAAIDEAYQVSPGRSLYNEARTRIDRWMDQLYRSRYPAPEQSSPSAAPSPELLTPELPPPTP